MRVSTKSRYGLRFMLELAQRDSELPVMLKDIAKAQGISEKYLSQIVIPLKKKGYIKSARGARGGYFIGKNPEEITMMDLVLALEDHFFIVECLRDPKSCPRIKKCVSNHFWAKLQFDITTTMRSHSLADMLQLHQEITAY